MGIALEDFGVQAATGEQRILCPQCGEQNRKKTCSVNTDEGVFYCFRCGYKGRLGGRDWLADQLERAKKSNRERTVRQAKAAENAQAMWKRAKRCLWHEYLRDKGILPLGTRLHGNLLVVPMYDVSGKLWNVQTVDQDGTKLFLKGGRTKDLYFPIKGESDEILIAEGFSTGAALHMYHYPHARVAIAFSAGNLLPVGEALRKKHPHTKLTIAADNDQWKEGNPGLNTARKAAVAINADVIYPTFAGFPLDTKPTDFCDLHLLQREAENG